MAAETVHTSGGRWRTASSVFAVLAMLFVLLGLTWLRRNPDPISVAFERGNTLGTHEGSGMSAADFSRVLGHVELAILASLLAICARRWARGPLVAACAAVLGFVGIYADSVSRYSTTIGGRLYFYICDDALISMRYARNFAEGRGLVYNAGEAVDGFTNPLWTALMVVPHALGLHESLAPLPIMALGGVLLLATALVANRTLADNGVEPAMRIAIGLAMAFDASLFEFSVAGLETPLLGLGSALVMTGGFTHRRWWIWTGIAAVTLGRADGAVVGAILLLWLMLEDRGTTNDPWPVVARRHTTTLALLVALSTALVAWRLAVYGHPAPNTYYLKVYSLGVRLQTGILSYGVRGLIMYGLPVAFVLLTVTRVTLRGARADCSSRSSACGSTRCTSAAMRSATCASSAPSRHCSGPPLVSRQRRGGRSGRSASTASSFH